MASLHYRKDRHSYRIALSLLGKRFWISVKAPKRKDAEKLLKKLSLAEKMIRHALKAQSIEEYIDVSLPSKFNKSERRKLALKLLSKLGETTL